MKKIFVFGLLFFTFSAVLFSCKKDTGGSSSSTGLTISLSKSQVFLAAPEDVVVTVKDENNVDVTTSCTIKVNGSTMTGSIYTPTASGSFDFVATKGSQTSNTANLVVVAVSGNTSDSLIIVLSKDTIEFNDFDSCTISVFDKFTNANVTAQAKIFVNSKNLVGTSYTALALQNVPVFASLGSKYSKVKICYVKAPATSPFTKKLLVEDFTGTWCGYCTRGAKEIEDYLANHPNNFIPVAVHGYAGTSDPFIFQYEQQLGSAFGVTGYPTILYNRKAKWDEVNATLDAELAKWAPLGLAVESSVNGTTISGKVKVKFNVTTSKSMKLVVCLTESGLTYNQTNYYSTLYGGANPILNFPQNNIMRKVATDLFGDIIPVAEQIKDNTYEFNFSMTTSGTTGAGASYTVDPTKCSIVAYVVDATTSKKGAYNVQKALVGTVKNFD